MDYPWAKYSNDRLLKLRFCDLKLKIKDSPVHRHILRLYDELAAKGLKFKPHCWIGNEWFSPDGVPGVAIPFYLFHRRLAKLEETMVYEVEGGTTESCMKLLRHETGHAIESAFRLRRRRKRQQLFGHSTAPYPDSYSPKPYSKNYVVNLGAWYAQAHPDEDFAETFAVWLNPKSAWKKRFKKWPAMRKLEYVDELMKEISGKPPINKSKEKIDEIRVLKQTLASHYRQKQDTFGMESASFFEPDLYKLFEANGKDTRFKTAAQFIKQERKLIRKKVARWTGHYEYTINEILDEVIEVCQTKKMRLKQSERATRLDLLGMLTAQTMNYLTNDSHKIVM